MKKIILSLVVLCFSFGAHSAAFAADQYWSETAQPSGGYLEFADKPFDYFAVHLPAGVEVEFRSTQGWQQIAIDDEQDPNSRVSELVSWNQDEPLLIRLGGKIPDEVTVDFMKIDALAISTSQNLLASTKLVAGIDIMSRSEWGADESWRYSNDETTISTESKNSDSTEGTRQLECGDVQANFPDEFETENVQTTEAGRKLIWPYQYSKKIRKVVIHHTAETGVKNGRTADEVMRAIYRYHTVSRGWGDIGYHYIIAPDGTIFEGRAGGDKVVGGHVYCNNVGTIGVALMGNFNQDDPTGPQIVALGKLLPRLAQKYELDLTTESSFHGKKTSNLLGHRDLGATACPGNFMYALLPDIRRMLSGTAEIIFAQKQSVDGKPKDSLSVAKLKPGQQFDLNLSFVNTGNSSWTNSTWLFAQAGDNVDILSVAGSQPYVAAKMKQKEVKPGETADFTVRMRAGYNGGVSTISFVPVVKDERVTNAETLQVIEVIPPDWQAKFVNIKTQPTTMVTGKTTSMSITLINNGGSLWSKDHVSLQVSVPGTKVAATFQMNSHTASGKSAVFSGRLPGLMIPGDQMLEMRLLLDGKWLPLRFLESISVKISDNRAQVQNLNKKVVLVKENSEYNRPIEIKNIGNTEWYQDELELTVLHRREQWKLHPQETVIKPGETATFPFKITIKPRVQPYVFLLKDGSQTLDRTPLILLGLKRAPVFGGNTTGTKPTPKPSITPTKTPAPTPVATPTQTTSDTIRIKLSFPTDKSSATITSTNSFVVTDQNGKLLSPARGGDNKTAAKLDQLVEFEGKSYEAIRFIPENGSGILAINNWDRYAEWDKSKMWNDNIFPGIIEVRVVDGALTVINELPLEQYLAGLGETLESNHQEKKKAIAIVARGYAQFYLDPANRKFPGKPYDGSDSAAEFQKYLGANVTKRSPLWEAAVKATAGEVVTYNGNLIKTPFHSCSGGKTTSAFDRWGWTNTPYLVSVDDPGCAGKPQSGHGVGLSGGGAQYFAEQGWDYKKILKYFYQGVQVEKL